jgi:hypothetical protein
MFVFLTAKSLAVTCSQSRLARIQLKLYLEMAVQKTQMNKKEEKQKEKKDKKGRKKKSG